MELELGAEELAVDPELAPLDAPPPPNSPVAAEVSVDVDEDEDELLDEVELDVELALLELDDEQAVATRVVTPRIATSEGLR